MVELEVRDNGKTITEVSTQYKILPEWYRFFGEMADKVDGTVLPVFGTVAEAMAETGADVSVLFVPPPFARDAAIEAIDAGMALAVIITEGIPVHDSAYVWAYAQGRGTRIVGPNCPGLISPGRSNAGIIPADITSAGPIGLVSKSIAPAVREAKAAGVTVGRTPSETARLMRGVLTS